LALAGAYFFTATFAVLVATFFIFLDLSDFATLLLVFD